MKNGISKQQFARERNWAKFKLMGITFNKKVMTKPELELIEQIQIRLTILKENFNTESISLGLKVKPRCKYCRRLLYKNNMCKRHKELNDI